MAPPLDGHQPTRQPLLPDWLAKAVIPVAILATLGASANLWRDSAVIADRQQRMEREFSTQIGNLASDIAGLRGSLSQCSATDCERTRSRLRSLEERVADLSAGIKYINRQLDKE